jgi:hypothetical protein
LTVAGQQRKGIATPLIVGVTSHRNIPVREMAPVRQRVREFLARLQRDYPTMPLVVLSALAEGGDQWVAEEALAMGARLVAPLPMARAHYAGDFLDAAARARYETLCDAATVIEVPDIGGSAPGALPEAPAGRERDLHYAKAGVYISQHCHILLAIWDGKPIDRLGGTAQIVAFHLCGVAPVAAERRRGAARAALLGNDSERLAYHIVCSRDAADGSPPAPLRPLQTFWRAGEHATPGEAPMPREFASMFAHASEFTADCATKAAPIAGAAQRARAGAPQAALAFADGAIAGLFCAADWLAIHFQRRVLLAMRTIYTLAALMGIAFMAYADLPNQDYMIYVFLVLFAVGVSLNLLAGRRAWHRKYLDYRALAEGLRVQSYWRRAGLSITGDAEFARDNFLQKQDVELGWIRNVMRSAALESVIEGGPPAAADLSNVIREWVGGDGEGQLGYYRYKATQRAHTHHITETLGVASLRVGIGISIVLAVFAHHLEQDLKTNLVAIMAVFSIIAAVREAYAYKKADKELIKQYRFMQRIFGEARSALDRAAGTDEQRDILRLLGEAAMAEHVEWALMHRERPLEHSKI